MKAAFAGFLAGVTLVMAIAWSIARHLAAEQAQAPETPAAPEAPVRPVQTPAGGIAELRERAAGLRAESARLADSLKTLSAANPGAPPSRIPRRSRRELGADLLRVFGPDGASNNALYTRVRMELAVLAGDVTDAEGVTPSQGLLSPGMLEEVFLGMREACAEAIPGGESEALRAAMDKYRKEWDAWKAGGKDADGYERAAALIALQRDARESLFGATDAAAARKLRMAMEEMDKYNDYCFPSHLSSESGDHAGTLVSVWVDDLGLGAAAVAALRPLAEEFAREQEPASAAEGAPVGTQELRRTQLALLKMAKVRQGIRRLVSLTPEQEKSLAAWQKVYFVSTSPRNTFAPSEDGK